MSNICVYSASSDDVAKVFYDAADALGTLIAEHGYTLVYGGGAIGLMGVMARAVHRNGGKVIGVIPEFMMGWDVAYEKADELIVTPDMRTRKHRMEEIADAFIGIPGGFGTLEEMLEVITLKQLQRHNKAVVFLNTDGFYDPLSAVFEHMFRENFAKQIYRELYYFSPDPPDAIRHIEEYIPLVFKRKV
ncbi:MAG: LOG family protein [Armatimonadota bacterium]